MPGSPMLAPHTHCTSLGSTGGWDECSSFTEEETALLLHPTTTAGKPSGWAARLNQHLGHGGTVLPSSLFSGNLSWLRRPCYPTRYSFYFYICETPALGAGKITGPSPGGEGRLCRSGGLRQGHSTVAIE